MTTEADLARVSRKLHHIGTALAPGAGPVKNALNKAGVAGRRAGVAVAVSLTGDGRMSHLNRGRGIKLGAGFEHTGAGEITYRLRPPGAWKLLDKGARAHQERPRRAQAMALPQGFAKRVNHPATRGKGAIRKADGAIRKAVPPAFNAALLGEIEHAWH